MQTRNIKPDAVIALGPKAAKYKGHDNSTHNTARTWAAVQTYLTKHPKCTRQQLFNYLREEYNHGCFVTYALGRGWLKAK